MADERDRTETRGPDEGPRTTSVEESVEAVRERVVACYQEHGGELGRFVLGVVRNPELAGDVMQATLSKALELGGTARAETLKGWIFRVAFHEAMALRRRTRAGDAAHRRLADRNRASASGRDAATGSPVEPLIRVETVRAVQQALKALPADQRRVVVARVYEDKTFAQIAREAGVPLGTVLTRMRLALEKLRRALRDDAGTGE